MSHSTPYGKIAGTTFGKKTVNVRIPFQVPTESVKNTDKAGSKVFRFVDFEK